MEYELTEKQIEAYWSKVDKTSSCWLWTGSLCKGYGQCSIGSKVYRSHRIGYFIANGDLPEGCTNVNHLCRNKHCVNPAHLYAGTQKDNMQDRLKDNTNPMKNKTHCKHGHPFDEENTYWYTDSRATKRQCKQCNKNNKQQRAKEALSATNLT